ncbi:EF-hand domain-containing family member B [Dunckerocampus dactyliophorus]|uniref:EF-hand domain-containing family member B n=1 Tax=Dunckerocampus dactyliophorus TaxID=161453 RepID=UPI002404BCB3|nr:EF-hand domain-containing family member B [Dunckerocampus dactyliophorus]
MNLTDRLTQLPRAGKTVPMGDRAEACLREAKRAQTPPMVRKYHNSNRPGPGVIRVHYGKANDPRIADTLVHGTCNKSSLTAADSLNPPPSTKFQQKLQDLSEAVYSSHRKAPLGRTPDQRPGLPAWYNNQTTFGLRTVRDVDAWDVIYPPKTVEELEREAEEAHRVYVRSHNSYFVGEQIDRKYAAGHYNKESRFGNPTPHFNDGRYVGRSLHWLGETKFYNPNPDWKTSDSSEMLPSQKRGSSLKLPPNHAFGVYIPQDEYGVAELIHCTQPGRRVRAEEQQRSLAGAVRHHLKTINFQNFPSLLEAFRHYDKKGKGHIDKEDLREVCRNFQLDVSESVLDDLVHFCDTNQNGFIDFLEFANFLTWKDKMPLNREEQNLIMDALAQTSSADDSASQSAQLPASSALLKREDLRPFKRCSSKKNVRTLRRLETPSDRFITTSSFIGAAIGEPLSSNARTFGIPSVRTDVPAPRNRRINDTINYGDMTTAIDLLLPSVNGRHGVYQDDFFCPRSKKEIAEIFRNVGVNISEETFEEAWKLASARHPKGDVCVEAFRAVLKEIKAL